MSSRSLRPHQLRPHQRRATTALATLVCLVLLLSSCSSGDSADDEPGWAASGADGVLTPSDVPTLTVGGIEAMVFGSEFVPKVGQAAVGYSQMESFEQWPEITVASSSSYRAVMSTSVRPASLNVWLMDELDADGEPGPPVQISVCTLFVAEEASCKDGAGEPSSLGLTVRADGDSPVEIIIEPTADLAWRVMMVQSNWSSVGLTPRANVAWFFMVAD